jgi:uncharacterized RDD family membrane protein YckC
VSDSNAKKPSDKPAGDWDFKVDSADVHEKRATAPVSKTGVHRLLNKRVKDESLGLNIKDVPKTVSRSNTEHYINNNSSKRKKSATTSALIGQRMTGAIVDIIFALILWQGAKLYSDWTFSQLLKLAIQFDLKQYLELPNIYYAIVGLNFIPLYLVFFVLPAGFMFKTPGKFVAKTTIDDIDGGDLGLARTFMRECVYKPISLLSVIGVLMFLFRKDKRALHDIMALSIVHRE